MMILIGAVLWWRGMDYYGLSLEDRVVHPDYRELRSSGLYGYGYGVVGTLLIFANLLYLARRRFARWKLGSMRTWLDLHVFTGMTGAVFVAFHSTFKARSTISKVTVLSLVVVVVTGLVGRFLFALVPKRDAKALDNALDEIAPLGATVADEIRAVIEAHPVQRTRGGIIGALLAIPMLRKIAATRRQSVTVLLGNAGASAGQIERIADEATQDVRVVMTAQLLRSWRAMHRFFAILMLLTVIFHIAVAWYYGYRWIFAE